MPVYIRTTAGRAAALNPLSLMPRGMRTLLTVIDGHSDSSVYASRLPSIGNVQQLLDSLENSGFIQIAYQTPTRTVATPLNLAASALFGAASGRGEAGRDVPWSDTHAGDLEPVKSAPVLHAATANSKFIEPPIAAPTIDELSSIASAQQQPALVRNPAIPAAIPEVLVPNLVPNNSTAHSSQYKLRSAVLMISDFVTLRLPNVAIEVILTLEGLETPQQLVASLDGYAALIAPLGQPAQAHLEQLRATLA